MDNLEWLPSTIMATTASIIALHNAFVTRTIRKEVDGMRARAEKTAHDLGYSEGTDAEILRGDVEQERRKNEIVKVKLVVPPE